MEALFPEALFREALRRRHTLTKAHEDLLAQDSGRAVSYVKFALCKEPAVVAGRSPAPCCPDARVIQIPAVVLAVAKNRPLARAQKARAR